ncbi:hypothetical protein K435DRAFT_615267, partial [Dendrothele bispora CBS 962.96]
HWVPLVIDGKHNRFLYGDSLQGQNAVIPPKLLEALMSWKSCHSLLGFTTGILDITAQDDNYSCGPYALNALDHFVRPGVVELVKPPHVSCVRLQAMTKIVTR